MKLYPQDRYDLVILDPPKFAPTAAQVKNAARAYKDINLWALKLLAPGGDDLRQVHHWLGQTVDRDEVDAAHVGDVQDPGCYRLQERLFCGRWPHEDLGLGPEFTDDGGFLPPATGTAHGH